VRSSIVPSVQTDPSFQLRGSFISPFSLFVFFWGAHGLCLFLPCLPILFRPLSQSDAQPFPASRSRIPSLRSSTRFFPPSPPPLPPSPSSLCIVSPPLPSVANSVARTCTYADSILFFRPVRRVPVQIAALFNLVPFLPAGLSFGRTSSDAGWPKGILLQQQR